MGDAMPPLGTALPVFVSGHVARRQPLPQPGVASRRTVLLSVCFSCILLPALPEFE